MCIYTERMMRNDRENISIKLSSMKNLKFLDPVPIEQHLIVSQRGSFMYSVLVSCFASYFSPLIFVLGLSRLSLSTLS
jgi:hypothetical protein